MFGALCCMCTQIDNNGGREGNDEEIESFGSFLLFAWLIFRECSPFPVWVSQAGVEDLYPSLSALPGLHNSELLAFFPTFSLLSSHLLSSLTRADLSPQGCLSLNSMGEAWRVRNVSLVHKVLCVGHWCWWGRGGEGEWEAWRGMGHPAEGW